MSARAETRRSPYPVKQEELGRARFRQIQGYGCKVYGIDALLSGVQDSRKDPQIPATVVVRILYVLGLLRIRSFNALEPRLAEPEMQRALGVPVSEARRICSADTLAYSLHRMDVATCRAPLIQVVRKAERNKVFREGWYGAMRFVAIDGWEPFSSYARQCDACLTREVRVGDEKRTQYYHRDVVALLLGEYLELVLEMEPIRSADIRQEVGEKNVEGHEGELTAAKRLIERLRTTYGRWIDILVLDALYSNGPILTLAAQCGFGVLSILKKETHEPLKEALALFNGEGPLKTIEDPKKHEILHLWDCPGLETLESYDGPIRVVRAVVRKAGEDKKHHWCFAVTGKACRLSPERVVAAGRARWHLENTGFHQWTHHWHFDHVFTHGPEAIPALMWLILLAFNMTQLFVYRQLGGYARLQGKDVTRTFLRLVHEMTTDVARLDQTLLWNDSS